ncbi:hypothetical protein [Mycolicibacterium arseniciresistens]|uniref:Ig-like domain-containing protein n=1 Tax=Mycolicibacterium arseniciresistens TaxID=3062257 RepID=A0ABT8UCD8_9MYCO|nr:hypothetical protein [Mycolicibacterium arseniciresistens]MDO3635432.1 hypothetical protein [Mycolicibacterium arseniciresistens]
MTTPTRLAIAAATVALAAISAIPATAHAEERRANFTTPSGNIRCVFDRDSGASPYVVCQLEDVDYVVPPGVAHDAAGKPCPSNTGSGNDVMLVQGEPGYVRCSFASISTGVPDWPTLEYGDTMVFGAITCDSESSALTCTDTSSGHFFRVSRLAYEVG